MKLQEISKFMMLLRLCEEALAREYHPADEMRCPVHFSVGQEAVSAALLLLLHHDDYYLYCHYRSRGYYLAKNAPMDALFAELYGKSTGANAGLAGSQDISYYANRFYSGAILTLYFLHRVKPWLASAATPDLVCYSINPHTAYFMR